MRISRIVVPGLALSLAGLSWLAALAPQPPAVAAGEPQTQSKVLKTYAKGPLPIISEDPKLKVLEKSPEYHYTIGYPGPLTVPADEVYQQFVLIAVAQHCTDKLDLEQTVKWADDKLKAIYSKFA